MRKLRDIFKSLKKEIIGLWCNGNTTVFGAVVLSSNLGSPTLGNENCS